MKNAALLLILFYTAVATRAQRLAPVEKKIADAVSVNMPQTFEVLKNVANINSGSLNVAGVHQVGELFRARLEKLGFSTQWVTFPDTVKSAGHLVATCTGNKGKRLLLLGHLDTVFEPDMPANPYRAIDDSTVTGQGVLDDKGGVVVMLAALEALARVDGLRDVTITVYLTGDEELGGVPVSVTRADIITRARQHDVALNFEAGNMDKVTTGRRGADTYTLTTYGTQAHSSGIFSTKAGYGAIYEATRILDSFRMVIPKQRFLTSNPGIIAGGTTLKNLGDHIEVYGKDNIIASAATVVGDIRFLGEQQRQAARLMMKAIAESGNLPGTHANIIFEDGIPSMEPTEANRKLAAQFAKVNTDMGFGKVTEVDPMSRGAGDISFIAGTITSLDGLGPSGQGSHAPGETLNTKELPPLIQRAAIFMYRLTRQ